jgi:hypothetical protein
VEISSLQQQQQQQLPQCPALSTRRKTQVLYLVTEQSNAHIVSLPFHPTSMVVFFLRFFILSFLLTSYFPTPFLGSFIQITRWA